MFNFFRTVEAPAVVDLEEQISTLKEQLEGLQEQQSLGDRIEELQVEVTDQATLLKAGKVEVAAFERKINLLKNDCENLKGEAKRADEDIKHMIKITKVEDALVMQKFEVDQKQKTTDAIGVVKDEYRTKMEVVLQKQIDDGKDLVSQVLAQLPTATLKIKSNQ